jgi:hypothetical protein
MRLRSSCWPTKNWLASTIPVCWPVVQPLAGEATESLIAAYQRAYPQATPGDLYASIAGDRMMRIHSITQAERKYDQKAASVFMYLLTTRFY